jgi:hypothetical protein
MFLRFKKCDFSELKSYSDLEVNYDETVMKKTLSISLFGKGFINALFFIPFNRRPLAASVSSLSTGTIILSLMNLELTAAFGMGADEIKFLM